jgi:hypothetical protein
MYKARALMVESITGILLYLLSVPLNIIRLFKYAEVVSNNESTQILTHVTHKVHGFFRAFRSFRGSCGDILMIPDYGIGRHFLSETEINRCCNQF